MLLKRIATAVVGIPIVISLILYGGIPFLALVLGLTFFGLLEFYDMMVHKGIKVPKYFFVGNGLVFIILSALHNKNTLIFCFFLLYILLSTILVQIFRNEPENSLLNAGVSFLGIMYVSWLNVHFIYLRELENGFFYVLLVFLVIWVNDSAAYFIGTKLGQKKLCPKISPNKTWEGALGGFVFSVLTTVLAGWVMNFFLTPNFTLVQLLVLGGLISLAGQLGDLAESLFKRDAGIKDSGNLIPGHGGILDRFDSLLFAVPLVYFYLQLVVLT